MSDEETPAAAPDPAPAPKAAKAPKGNPKTKWLIFIVVSILSLVADQGTKIWARQSLPATRDHKTVDTSCVIPDDLQSPDDKTAPRCAGLAVPVVESFWHWRLSMNPGSAFGLFSGQAFARVLLSLVGIGAVFGMIWMLKKSRNDQRILHWALALVAGGAVGNLIDRIYYGVVTDMILWHVGDYDPVYHRWAHEWPVFNVADIVLVVGVGLMFIDIQKEGKRDKEKRRRRDEKARKAGLIKDHSTDDSARSADAAAE